MAWDYRNPTPPERGDGRYEKKYPHLYPILDILRVEHYTLFDEDLSFQGTNDVKTYGSDETRLLAYTFGCKKFAGISAKELEAKEAFRLWTESSRVGNPNQYVEFTVQKKLFELEQNKKVLQFIKLCLQELVGRNVNFVISGGSTLRFIHVPFDRKVLGGAYGSNITSEEFINFVAALYDNTYYCMHMISPEILSRLNSDELAWFQGLQQEDSLYSDLMEEQKIEVASDLAYVRVRK